MSESPLHSRINPSIEIFVSKMLGVLKWLQTQEESFALSYYLSKCGVRNIICRKENLTSKKK